MTDMLEILVVEDDPALRDWLRRAFDRQGHRVTLAAGPGDALTLARGRHFDMILLDVELGGSVDGFQICRALREDENDVPIIMLTGLRAEADAVKGLEAGADDYMTKPFGLAELNSRIRAVLRRTAKQGSEPLVRQVGTLRMDLERREVTLGGTRVHLTFSEFQLLAALLEHPGAVRSRAELMAAIWGDSAYRDPRGIDVHVRHLREKLGKNVIGTVRGGGYRVEGASSS